MASTVISSHAYFRSILDFKNIYISLFNKAILGNISRQDTVLKNNKL